MTKVLILGASGMLGSMVARVLRNEHGIEVTSTSRTASAAGAHDVEFDAARDPLEPLLESDSYSWVINAIGILKAQIDDANARSIANAIEINSLFPYRLAAATARRNQRVIQIATDGVFAGTRGPYNEASAHDAVDVYGKTKSLGEVPASNVISLRCSILGLDPGAPKSFLSRILAAPPGAELAGYTAQMWNGITTLHFARLCMATILATSTRSAQHIIPADRLSKYELVRTALAAFNRKDVSVRPEPGPEEIDRTLDTKYGNENRRLWAAAGYEQPPMISAMLRELASFRTADRT